MKWLKNIITNLRAKSISQQKLQTAAVLQDEQYLHWAYAYGSQYLQQQIIDYLADIKTQTNYEFLLKQMKNTATERVKKSLYVALLDIILDEKIMIQSEDEKYLQQHLDLLEGIDTKPIYRERKTTQPMMFRDKLKDHLGILEQMKKKNTHF